jgi:hypothetical protein
MKAVGFLLALGVAGCSTQGAHGVPVQDRTPSSVTGPALPAPSVRRPMENFGGPTGMMLTSMGDGAPVLAGKTLAHFYVGVREIDAIANGQTVVLGSSITPTQIDLLQYQNGSTDWMTQTSVPAQTYTQMRYVLDLGSTQAIFSDGSTMPVKFAGGSSKSSYNVGYNTATTYDATYANAIDVTISTSIGVNGTASVAADFNLTESLNVGNNSITMRPTLTAAATPAQIAGTVANTNGGPVQNATVVAVGSNGTAVTSATTDASGSFNLHALPADTYQLVVYNNYTNAAGYKVNSSGATSWASSFNGPVITVNAGATAAAGTIND